MAKKLMENIWKKHMQDWQRSVILICLTFLAIVLLFSPIMVFLIVSLIK